MDNNGWITLDEWCEKYSERPNTIHKRVSDGHWIRGDMVSAPDGGTLYVREQKAREWLEVRGKLVL